MNRPRSSLLLALALAAAGVACGGTPAAAPSAVGVSALSDVAVTTDASGTRRVHGVVRLTDGGTGTFQGEIAGADTLRFDLALPDGVAVRATLSPADVTLAVGAGRLQIACDASCRTAILGADDPWQTTAMLAEGPPAAAVAALPRLPMATSFLGLARAYDWGASLDAVARLVALSSRYGTAAHASVGAVAPAQARPTLRLASLPPGCICSTTPTVVPIPSAPATVSVLDLPATAQPPQAQIKVAFPIPDPTAQVTVGACAEPQNVPTATVTNTVVQDPTSCPSTIFVGSQALTYPSNKVEGVSTYARSEASISGGNACLTTLEIGSPGFVVDSEPVAAVGTTLGTGPTTTSVAGTVCRFAAHTFRVGSQRWAFPQFSILMVMDSG